MGICSRARYFIFYSVGGISMTEHQQPKEQIVDMAQLEEYMLTRASEFQKRGFWDSSFECLYLITVLNRGYYWDTEGRKQIIRSRPHTPAQPTEAQQRIDAAIKDLEKEIEDQKDLIKHTTGHHQEIHRSIGNALEFAITRLQAGDP